MSNSFDILVKGDFRQLTKGFIDLSKKFDDLGKKKLSFKFDESTKKFMSEAGAQVLRRLKTELAAANAEMKKFAKSAHESADAFGNFQKAAGRVSSITEDIRGVQQGVRGATQSRFGRAIGGAVRGIGGKLGLPEGLVGRGLMGDAALFGGGALGGALTGGALATAAYWYKGYKMGKEGLDAWHKQVPGKISLQGMGISNARQSQLMRGGASSLFGTDETLGQATALARATGTTEGLGSIQRYSTAFGLDPSQLIGMSGSYRQMGKGYDSTQNTLKGVLAEAVSSGIDRARLPEYLQEVSEYTGQMSEERDVDPIAVARSVSEIMKNAGGGYFSQAGGATSALSAMDAMFKGSAQGGSSIGMTEKIMEQLYPGAGANKLLMMMERGTNQQIDPESLKRMVDTGRMSPEMAADLQGKSTHEVYSALARETSGQIKKMGLTGADAAIQASRSMFGGKVDPARAWDFMQSVLQGASPKDQSDALAAALESATGNELKSIKSSTEGAYKEATAIREILLATIGKNLSAMEVKGMQGLNAAEKFGYESMSGAAPDLGMKNPDMKGQGGWFDQLLNVLNGGSSSSGGGSSGGGVFDRMSDYINDKGIYAPKNNAGGTVGFGSGASYPNVKSADIGNQFLKENQQFQEDIGGEFASLFPEFKMTSAFRDSMRNQGAKGAKNSKHTRGFAADFSRHGLSPERIAQAQAWSESKGYSLQYHSGPETPHYHLEATNKLINEVQKLNKTMAKGKSNPTMVLNPNGLVAVGDE